jgi:hypothetical protein
MNPADEIAAKIGPTQRHLAGATAGSGEKSDQQLRAILENLQRAGLRGSPVEQMKRRGSRGFARYLVAILIGVAATLAWQSYGEAAKQVIATSAPELGWSPEAKQTIASWVQRLGWTKPPVVENTEAPVAQTAPENVAPKAPTGPSFDPEQVQQMAQNLAAVRETVQELAAGQTQMGREIAKLESAVVEILSKIPEPPPQPPAAPARKPTPVPPSSRAPIPPRQ